MQVNFFNQPYLLYVYQIPVNVRYHVILEAYLPDGTSSSIAIIKTEVTFDES